MNKNFKFITNCIIMQKADCGLNLSGSCYWDNEVDGTVTVKWDSPSLVCVVNVFGCALWYESFINHINILISICPYTSAFLQITTIQTICPILKDHLQCTEVRVHPLIYILSVLYWPQLLTMQPTKDLPINCLNVHKRQAIFLLLHINPSMIIFHLFRV